jgi:hypothetical protein
MLVRLGLMSMLVLPATLNPAEKSYWIIRGPEGNCTIVETEPEPTQTALEKFGRYASRREAEADLDRVCTITPNRSSKQ